MAHIATLITKAQAGEKLTGPEKWDLAVAGYDAKGVYVRLNAPLSGPGYLGR